MVPALQSRLERRRRQPAEPERHQGRLPVARRAVARQPDRHSGELRPGGGVKRRQDRQEPQVADMAALPPTRRGAPPAGRRRGAWGGAALPDPALGGQRQEQFHRLAGAPIDRPEEGRRGGLRFHHRGHRPAHPGQTDSRHHPAVLPGQRHSGARRPLGRPASLHRERQEDHHLDGAEVPVHPQTKSATSSAAGASPSSSTRRTPARAGAPAGR